MVVKTVESFFSGLGGCRGGSAPVPHMAQEAHIEWLAWPSRTLWADRMRCQER